MTHFLRHPDLRAAISATGPALRMTAGPRTTRRAPQDDGVNCSRTARSVLADFENSRQIAAPARTKQRDSQRESVVGNERERSIEASIASVLQRKLGPYVAPRTPTEQKLAQIWRDVLGVDRVGITDSYEDLGVDSLLAASIFVEIEDTFAISIPTAALVDAPTIEQLARKIDGLASRRVK